MDWYKFYVGDYARDTSHLTPLEHGVYLLLINRYYSSEEPLRDDFDWLCRVAQCRSRHEKDALRSIRDQFFDSIDGKLMHRRIDQEIVKYQQMRDTNRKAVELRWQYEKGTIPEARNQIPEKEKGISVEAGASTPPKPVNGHHYLETAEGLIRWFNQKCGKGWKARSPNGKPTAIAELIVARLKEGYTERQCRITFARKWNDWKDDDKMAAYIRPSTIFRKSHFAEYLAQWETEHQEQQ